MNTMILGLAKKVLFWALNYIYNYTDLDNDGTISKDELKSQIYEPVLRTIKRINKHRNK